MAEAGAVSDPHGAARHAVCGLSIVSNAPVAGLPPAHTAVPPDLWIEMHAGAPLPESDSSARVWYVSPDLDEAGAPALIAARSQTDGSAWLRYSEGACYRVDASGSRVDAWWRGPLTDVDVSTYLLGPVLAFVMRVKGVVPLHASAVAIGGRAALFLGEAGAGKSTTAAAFATLGYSVLSDDIVPITVQSGGFAACPGYPRLSIWPDSAEALFGPATALPSFSATYDKRYIDLEPAGLGFQSAPLPVGSIFVLGDQMADRIAITPMRAREGVLALAANTYGGYLMNASMRAAEFDVVARLVSATPVYGLTFGSGLAALREGCTALAEHVMRLEWVPTAPDDKGTSGR